MLLWIPFGGKGKYLKVVQQPDERAFRPTRGSRAKPVVLQHVSPSNVKNAVITLVEDLCRCRSFQHPAILLRFQWLQVEDDLSQCMNYAAAAAKGLEAMSGWRSEGAQAHLNPSSFICYAPQPRHLLIKHSGWTLITLALQTWRRCQVIWSETWRRFITRRGVNLQFFQCGVLWVLNRKSPLTVSHRRECETLHCVYCVCVCWCRGHKLEGFGTKSCNLIHNMTELTWVTMWPANPVPWCTSSVLHIHW